MAKQKNELLNKDMEIKVSNTNLHGAKKAKKDEFYTQLVDIEKELKHYKDQFRGKAVYCNWVLSMHRMKFC